MSKKIVLFNGPPGAGKDTLAAGLYDRHQSAIVKFAGPIKKNCRAIYGLTLEEWNEIDGSQATKEEPNDAFFGETCRQVQINFSELFLKPTHGEDVFGHLAVKAIYNKIASLILVSDSGFTKEAEVLINEFGAENIILVKINRDGCTFEGDSRNYIDLTQHGVNTITVNNNGSVIDAVEEVEYYLKQKGFV